MLSCNSVEQKSGMGPKRLKSREQSGYVLCGNSRKAFLCLFQLLEAICIPFLEASFLCLQSQICCITLIIIPQSLTDCRWEIFLLLGVRVNCLCIPGTLVEAVSNLSLQSHLKSPFCHISNIVTGSRGWGGDIGGRVGKSTILPTVLTPKWTRIGQMMACSSCGVNMAQTDIQHV